MYLVDSHAHLFLEEFTQDLPMVIERAKQAGVTHIFMPNIDSTTIEPLLKTCDEYPDCCFPMIGLHPTSVKDDYLQELGIVQRQLEKNAKRYVAIGEIGLDLYWDKTYLNEQLVVFERQIEWALQYNLPIVIHTRDAAEQRVLENKTAIATTRENMRKANHMLMEAYDNFLKSLYEKEVQLLEEERIAKEKLQEEQEKLAELEKAVKVLEKHKEKALEAYKAEENAAELKRLSEVAIQKHFQKSRENAEEEEYF